MEINARVRKVSTWLGAIRAVAFLAVHSAAFASATQWVDATPLDVDGNSYVADQSISDDGQYVAFTSSASNLVPSALGNWYRAYVRDVVTGSVTVVSKPSTGTIPNLNVRSVRISGDGRIVIFVTGTALVANDLNSALDVYAYDRIGDIVDCVSRGVNGLPWLRRFREWCELPTANRGQVSGTLTRVDADAQGAPISGVVSGEVALSADGLHVGLDVSSAVLRRRPAKPHDRACFGDDGSGPTDEPVLRTISPGQVIVPELYAQCLVIEAVAVKGVSLSKALNLRFE